MKLIRIILSIIIIILVLIANKYLFDSYNATTSLIKFINGSEMEMKENIILGIQAVALITIIYIITKKKSKTFKNKENTNNLNLNKYHNIKKSTQQKIREKFIKNGEKINGNPVDKIENEKNIAEPEIDEGMEELLGRSMWGYDQKLHEELIRNFQNEEEIIKKANGERKDLQKEEFKKKIKRTHNQFQLKFNKNENKSKTDGSK